ncbi:WXG100 family type VII secretion target [Streptomyces aureus]|uniref:WXG100 family type VII secretion target n=1 Tax=Streptomyces aureus TaxID=193461 RepID=UPI0036B48479
MTARPRDWTPMYDSDPVPGDPHEVARLGKKLRGMAEEIDKQARNIRALASVDGWDSDAGRAFHETASDTAGRLKKVYDRYDEASKALGTQVKDGESDEYAGELHRAQRMADGALDDFRAAEVDHKAAQKVLEPYTGTVPSQEDHVERTKQEKKRDDAAHLMAVARSKIESAKEIRDDAAKRAAHRIKNVIHHDGVHDPGGIMNWIADHADWISTAATVLAVAALIAAVVLSGGTLAIVLVGLASALSATALSGRLYDVFARGGKFDWLKITFDVLGIIPGLGALKGLSAAAKGSRLIVAQEAVWAGFTNGFAVKSINRGVGLASKYLAKKGITKVKLPANGFDPEGVTRFIKGAAFGNAYVQSLIRLRGRFGADDTTHPVSPPPGDTRPTPAPDVSPRPPGPSGTPSPTPQPSPSPTSFHAALAPTG